MLLPYQSHVLHTAKLYCCASSMCKYTWTTNVMYQPKLSWSSAPMLRILWLYDDYWVTDIQLSWVCIVLTQKKLVRSNFRGIIRPYTFMSPFWDFKLNHLPEIAHSLSSNKRLMVRLRLPVPIWVNFFLCKFNSVRWWQSTVFKNKLLTKVHAPKNRLAHENHCIKRPSQLRQFRSISLDLFFPSECPGLRRP